MWKQISIFLLEKHFFAMDLILCSEKIIKFGADLIWCSEKKWHGFNLAIFAILRQLRQIFSVPKFIWIRYVVDTQSYICRRCLLLQGLCVPSVRATAYVCNRFDTPFCARDHEITQASSNLNRKFWSKSTQQIKSTTSLTDLCFNKKFEQEKKVYIK